MALHQNIDPESLTTDGRLLAPVEVDRVLEIETFIKSITENASDLLSLKNANMEQLTELYSQQSVAANPYSFIDKLILPQHPESLSAWRIRVLDGLSDFINHLNFD